MREAHKAEEEYESIKDELQKRIGYLERNIEPAVLEKIRGKSEGKSHDSSIAHRCPCHHRHLFQHSHSSSYIKLPQKETIRSEGLETILMEGLRTQQEISKNLKMLYQKISLPKSPSHTYYFDYQGLKKGEGIKKVKNQGDALRKSKNKKKIKVKSSSQRMKKMGETRSKSWKKQGKWEKEKEKEKIDGEQYSEYFQGQKKKSNKKTISHHQIYKDPDHRNRKQEQEHLAKSFALQSESRKKLTSKILKNSGFRK